MEGARAMRLLKCDSDPTFVELSLVKNFWEDIFGIAEEETAEEDEPNGDHPLLPVTAAL